MSNELSTQPSAARLQSCGSSHGSEQQFKSETLLIVTSNIVPN